jgi:hypothetical protein
MSYELRTETPEDRRNIDEATRDMNDVFIVRYADSRYAIHREDRIEINMIGGWSSYGLVATQDDASFVVRKIMQDPREYRLSRNDHPISLASIRVS